MERLNYVQYYPVVVFCEPDSRQGIKAMRQWLAPGSKKSSRRLYAQAVKMKKNYSYLFTAAISLGGSTNTWYQSLKEIIRAQQARPIWTAEEQVPGESFSLLQAPAFLSSLLPALTETGHPLGGARCPIELPGSWDWSLPASPG